MGDFLLWMFLADRSLGRIRNKEESERHMRRSKERIRKIN